MSTIPRAAWLRDDALPPMPEGAPRGSCGWIDREGAHAAFEPSEVMDAIARDGERRILVGWRPDASGRVADDRMRPVHELFPAACLGRDAAARARARPAEQRGLVISAVLIVGFLALLVLDLRLPPIVVIGVVLFGMSPFERALDFFEHRAAGRLSVRAPERAAEVAASRTRYMLWLSRQGRGLVGPGLAGVFVAIYLLEGHANAERGVRASVEVAGLVKPLVASEPYRLLTAAFMHQGLVHLASNGLMTVAIARALEPLLGPGRMLWVFLVGAGLGNVASWMLLEAPSLGASGGILAFVGALAGVGVRRADLRQVGLQRMGARILLLMVVVGLVGAHFIDNAAHAGGAVAGIALGWAFASGAGDPAWRRPLSVAGLSAYAVTLAIALLTAGLLWQAAG